MNLRLAHYLLLASYTTICFAQSEEKYINYIPLSLNIASVRQYEDYPVYAAITTVARQVKSNTRHIN